MSSVTIPIKVNDHPNIRPLNVLRDLASNSQMTMLIVTHEMGFARKIANRVILMDGGEIIEQNEPEEFFNNPQSSRTKLFLSQILHH